MQSPKVPNDTNLKKLDVVLYNLVDLRDKLQEGKDIEGVLSLLIVSKIDLSRILFDVRRRYYTEIKLLKKSRNVDIEYPVTVIDVKNKIGGSIRLIDKMSVMINSELRRKVKFSSEENIRISKSYRTIITCLKISTVINYSKLYIDHIERIEDVASLEYDRSKKPKKWKSLVHSIIRNEIELSDSRTHRFYSRCLCSFAIVKCGVLNNISEDIEDIEIVNLISYMKNIIKDKIY